MYEIIIKQKSIVTITEQGKYTIVEERPYTEEEMKEACSDYRTQDDPKNDHFIKHLYGYPPNREKQEEIEREIFRMEIDGDIDIWHVIDAINRASK